MTQPGHTVDRKWTCNLAQALSIWDLPPPPEYSQNGAKAVTETGLEPAGHMALAQCMLALMGALSRS